MTLSIVQVRAASDQEWDSTWANCDYATYFHSREWAEIWQVYTRGRIHPDPKLFLFSDGMTAILPFSVRKSRLPLLFPQTYISSPAGTFGGWISLDRLTDAHIGVLTEYLFCKIRSIEWRLNPYGNALPACCMHFSQPDETQVLHLTDGFEAIYKTWTKGHRSAARKALKQGVSVLHATTLEDWRNYYHVYEASLRRWGEKTTSYYAWPMFLDMFQRRSPHIQLWLAVYGNKVISGALCFKAKKHIAYWHGASLKEYSYLRPVNLLMYEIIKDSCNHQCRWFDFNPSGGHDGVTAFKRSFGAIALPCPILTKTPRWSQCLLTVRGKVSAAIRRLVEVSP